MNTAMVMAAIQTLLSIVGTVLPLIEGKFGSASPIIDKVISGLQAVLPLVPQLGSDIVGEVQGIVNALRNGSTPLTDQQLADLDAVDAALDTAFDTDAANDGFPVRSDP